MAPRYGERDGGGNWERDGGRRGDEEGSPPYERTADEEVWREVEEED